MTEAEWIACDDPDEMVRFLAGLVSSRKLRWFACACCRRLWEHVKEDDARKALVRAERYADGLIAEGTARSWNRRARAAAVRHARSRAWDGYVAVSWAGLPGHWMGRVYIHRPVAHAFAHLAGHKVGSEAWREVARSVMRDLVPLLRDVAGNPFLPAAVEPAWLARDGGVVVRLRRGRWSGRFPATW